jgi:hypothetical protein
MQCQNLTRKPPPQKVMSDFFRRLGYYNSEAIVCSYDFADLRRNGVRSLVVGLGVKDTPSAMMSISLTE